MSNINEQQIAQMAVQQLLASAAHAERQIDAELAAMSKLDGDDLERLRHKRIAELKAQQAKVQEWRRKGHGKYEEVNDQKAWFQEVKDNERVVCHFYRNQTAYCALVDHHLEQLARAHMETRFIKINAENSPFLVERLLVVVMPTIIMTKDGATLDRLEGFCELGNTDRFTTAQLEERMAKKRSNRYAREEKVKIESTPNLQC